MRAAGLFTLLLPICAEHHRYLIIGAGPGGLQMAHYLQSAGRDYLLLEKSNRTANFFHYAPSWRELISINKRNVGTKLLDFNLRHDWNSLLSDCSPSAKSCSGRTWTDPTTTIENFNNNETDPKLLFRAWSRELFPSANDLVEYFDYYTKYHHLSIEYEREVTSVDKKEGQFQVTTSGGEVYTSDFLMIGTGLGAPNQLPQERGWNQATTYTTASTNRESYEGKRVLIVGRGNAAFEFAENIIGETHYVHVLGRTRKRSKSSGRIRLAWETHYPGALRAKYYQLLESYMLKSMDGMQEEDMENFWLFRDNKTQLLHTYDGSAGDATSVAHASQLEDFMGSSRHGYHEVIVCAGWHIDTSMFKGDTVPELTHGGKFAKISAKFESTSVPGMFFLGALMHMRDYRHAAGGFIHGFRYQVRSLHRMLEQSVEKEHGGQRWPMKSWTQPKDSTHDQRLAMFDAIEKQLVFRLNHASAIYQMFGQLGELFVMQENSDGEVTTSYFEEVPTGYIPALFLKENHTWFRDFAEPSFIAEHCPQKDCTFVMLTLEYGAPVHEPGTLDPFRRSRVPSKAEDSSFLHPVFRQWRYGPYKSSKASAWEIVNKVHLIEDFLQDFSFCEDHVEGIRRVFEAAYAAHGVTPEWRECEEGRKSGFPDIARDVTLPDAEACLEQPPHAKGMAQL